MGINIIININSVTPPLDATATLCINHKKKSRLLGPFPAFQWITLRRKGLGLCKHPQPWVGTMFDASSSWEEPHLGKVEERNPNRREEPGAATSTERGAEPPLARRFLPNPAPRWA